MRQKTIQFGPLEPAGPRVTNIRDNVRGAVLVDRRTPWGNPFILGRDGNRDEVCDKFAAYAADRLRREPGWLEPLRGRDLACHCSPLRCHAKWLLANANDS